MTIRHLEADPLVDAEAGGEFLGIKANTLRKWARDGRLPSVRVRGSLRFRLSTLRALIRETESRKEGQHEDQR